jgi:hypothetical protein
MYSTFWDNVSRYDDAAWKMMASYAALIAAIFFVYDKIGALWAGASLMTFSFIGLLLNIKHNWWFVRNMGLISNLQY